MTEFATTRLSSKGRVVIPEEIRVNLKLTKGTEFIVTQAGDSIILKVIRAPSLNAVNELQEQAKLEAKRAGLRKSDLIKSLQKVRKRK